MVLGRIDAYDMFGNRIVTTDALGNTVFKSYDPFGRVVAEWGATYPVCYAYDTQGRRTSLATTRDGIAWDTTTWAYDAATGLCLSKTYADGSSVTYTYTPDNFLLRTTYASGRWRENTYDTSRRLVAENFGGGSGGAGGSPAEIDTFAHDVFGRRISEANSVSSIAYQRDTYGNCTNETTIVAGGPQSPAAAETYSIDREFDAHSRLVRYGDTYYTYASDGRLTVISNAEAIVEYAYTSDRFDAGYTLTLTNGTMFSRAVVRDTYRRSLVTAITNSVNGVPIETFAYAYDALGRPAARCRGVDGSPAMTDTFTYNDRSEVTSAILHSPFSILHSYGYDGIGNSTNFIANCLNQYTLCGSVPLCEFTYDLDGNLLSNGGFSYAYDAENRLSSVTSNGVLLVTNFYDAQSRRVEKVAADGTHRFFYDGWLLVREALTTNHYQLTTDYVWGKDISGTRGGAAGIGGLLYVRRDGAIYVPRFDAYGNVRGYCDAQGSVVAEYTYDAFGNTIAQSGPMADDFALRFSTKYFDGEANLYYYGYRYYHPSLMRWLNRDPIEEEGGGNLYAFCGNNGIDRFDKLGNIPVRWWGTPNDFSITKCDGKQKEVLRQAVSTASMSLGTALDLTTSLISEIEDFKNGTADISRLQTFLNGRSDVIKYVDELHNFLNAEYAGLLKLYFFFSYPRFGIRCGCSDPFFCRDDTFAYVRPKMIAKGKDNNIHVCPLFFTRPASKQPQTLVHEASHWILNAEDSPSKREGDMSPWTLRMRDAQFWELYGSESTKTLKSDLLQVLKEASR